RAAGPVVVVDCGAIAPGVIERELFGHVRGAYTGAVADAPGAFEQADGGTLFLDEIGELPLELQPKLLRAVENRRVRRVGDHGERAVDIRIIAATNRPLEQEVNRGTFRADLYYRLSVVQVHIPPLRERLADIARLARVISVELGLDPGVLSEDLIEQLRRHRWPGNVRELRNAVRRLAFGDQTLQVPTGGALAPAAASSSSVDLSLPLSEAKQLANDRFEHDYLSALMQRAEGKIAHAARLAQTDRAYLSRLLKKHKLKSG
ncbi:MAG: sigma-54-dependent Fis family transcriptional regulator, partial [Myxococcales bacterium]|nr:sigma-54-dependent Fis family transcriptional regulator [Myxococcales bacterium]